MSRNRVNIWALVETVTPIVALAGLMLFCALRSPTFLQPQNLVNILEQRADVGIIAVGMTLVIIAGGIDLSVGSLFALAGSIGVMAMNLSYAADQHPQAGDWLVSLHLAGGAGKAVCIGIIAALLCGLLGGLLNGLVIAKGKVAPFVATLGSMAAFRSLALVLGDAGTINAENIAPFQTLGSGGIPTWMHDVTGHTLRIPYMVVVFIVVAVLGQILLSLTRYGRYVVAVGCNERAAVYSAVAADRIKIITYCLIGLCVGLSAILLAANNQSISTSQGGLLYELDAIAAVVIGGTRLSGGYGAVWRTVIGVLLLGVIRNMLNLLNVPANLHGLVEGMIIIVAVLLQRFGRKT